MEKMPQYVYKHRFELLNILLIAVWLLVIVDYVLPRSNSTELVEEVEEVTRRRRGRSNTEYILYTTGPSTEVSHLVNKYEIAPGDTVQMESSPIFRIVYGLRLKNKQEPCCKYDTYVITLEDNPVFLLVGGISILLLFTGTIPSFTFGRKKCISSLAYGMSFFAYACFKWIHF